jgi:hypothetical protein
MAVGRGDSVFETGNGEEALQKAQSERFDILLLYGRLATSEALGEVSGVIELARIRLMCCGPFITNRPIVCKPRRIWRAWRW